MRASVFVHAYIYICEVLEHCSVNLRSDYFVTALCGVIYADPTSASTYTLKVATLQLGDLRLQDMIHLRAGRVTFNTIDNTVDVSFQGHDGGAAHEPATFNFTLHDSDVRQIYGVFDDPFSAMDTEDNPALLVLHFRCPAGSTSCTSLWRHFDDHLLVPYLS